MSKTRDNAPENAPQENAAQTEQSAAEKETEQTQEAPAPETETPPAEKSGEEKLREELEAEKDKYLRLAAEYDNFRRRSARERDSIYADVKADTLTRLLPVYDNLERALRQETADAAFRKGVEMTLTQFTEVLASLGVTPIEALGKTFDPALHNAVMHTDDPEKGESEIVLELQRGFRMGERVIRHSMVPVAN